MQYYSNTSIFDRIFINENLLKNVNFGRKFVILYPQKLLKWYNETEF